MAQTQMLAELAEDLRTAWAPDVLGGVDAEQALNTSPVDGTLGHVDVLDAPRPDGSILSAPVLGYSAHGELHRAVDGFRDDIDSLLAPGVCGYRRGAERGFSYSTENRRFQELTEGEAADARFVVFADVRRFFDHCSWDVVLAHLEGALGDTSKVDVVREFAKAALASNVRTLPAGYADARLLGNAVLAEADSEIRVPFVRWVDDYRMFASDENEAQACIDDLQRVLGRAGMELNPQKLSIVPAAKVPSLNGLPLESVYHPDVESRAQVVAALRSVFLRAVQDPARSRRDLRFVLPRLAAQGDDIAVDWVLGQLLTTPWEAPRFSVYLAAFAERAAVRSAVERALVEALNRRSAWLASRLAALACYTGVSEMSAANLVDGAHASSSSTAWGLVLRALSLSGWGRQVHSLIDEGCRDPRAVLAALRDLGDSTDEIEPFMSTETLGALGDGSAPRPLVDSIL